MPNGNRSAHPLDRESDRLNPDRIMELFNKLHERLIVASELVTDEGSKDEWRQLALRVDALHHDAAELIFG